MKKILLFIPFLLVSFLLSPLVTHPAHAASPIKTVFIIVMENHDWSQVKGSAAPYITNTLLPMGAHAENYRNGDVHPSAPNYVALEAGAPVVGTGDCKPTDSGCSSSGPHLSKLLDAAGIPWKEYAEDTNGTSCILDFSGADVNHIPFSYFTDVTNNNNPNSANCIAHERPFTELSRDLQNNTVARYNFITPSVNNNMHNGTIQQGDTWLSQLVPMIMNSSAYKNGGVIFITWDEDSGSNNPIGFIAISQYAKTNYSNTIAYSHESTLRTLEEIFGVSPMLGGAASATDLSDLFTTPLTGTGGPSPTTVTNPTVPAPTAITPTVYCVGGSAVPPCATLPPNGPTTTTTISVAPSGGTGTTILPTQNPCVSTASNGTVHAFKVHKHKKGSISNFFQMLLQFLITLLQQLLGITIQLPGNGNPLPTAVPQSPVPSTAPPVSGQPGPSSNPTGQPHPCVSPTTTTSTTPSNAVSPSAAPSSGVTTNPAATGTTSLGPKTNLHYTANGNFSGSTYLPSTAGFNLADVGSVSEVNSLPTGVKGLVYLSLCNGADSNFTSTIQPYIGNPKVFGFFVYDEPDPTGKYKTVCPASNLKAESDWIHQNDPGAKTFIVLMNFSSSKTPTYMNTYNPANSDIDLYGIDGYACRTDYNGCDNTFIANNITAVKAAGVPVADIVPVYQAFGGGSWVDDGGGAYIMPSASQETQMLNEWAVVVPNPVFDYAYSWGSQNGDQALSGDTSLQQVFATHNK